MKDSDKIGIKAAVDNDADELTYLYRKLYKGDEDQEFFNSKAIPSYFNSGSKVFVAKDGNKAVGFIWVIYYEHIKNKGIGIIEELYIDNNYRRKGIGKKLILKAVGYLKKKQVIAIIVTTGPHMENAKKFYKAMGFKISREWFYYPLS